MHQLCGGQSAGVLEWAALPMEGKQGGVTAHSCRLPAAAMPGEAAAGNSPFTLRDNHAPHMMCTVRDKVHKEHKLAAKRWFESQADAHTGPSSDAQLCLGALICQPSWCVMQRLNQSHPALLQQGWPCLGGFESRGACSAHRNLRCVVYDMALHPSL